jgi:hypothetical protein
MGSSFTKNISKEAVTGSIDILNSTISTCSNPVSTTNSTNLNASGNSTIIYGGNNSQSITVTSSCVATSVSRNNADYGITEKTKQTVDSVSQQFSLSRTRTKSVYKTMIDVSSQITDEFNQNCVNGLTTSNTVNVNASDNSTVIAVVDSSQTANLVANCILNSDTVSSSTTQLEVDLSSAVTSKVQNFLFYLVILVIGVGVIAAIIVIALIIVGVIGKKKPVTRRKKSTTSKTSTVKKVLSSDTGKAVASAAIKAIGF